MKVVSIMVGLERLYAGLLELIQSHRSELLSLRLAADCNHSQLGPSPVYWLIPVHIIHPWNVIAMHCDRSPRPEAHHRVSLIMDFLPSML